MPTAARLIAAIWFGALAFMVAEMVKTHMPEDSYFGHMSRYCLSLGASIAWFYLGARAARPMKHVIGQGLTTVFLIILAALTLFAFEDILSQSLMHGRVWDIERAISKLIMTFVNNGALLLNVDIALTLIVGGLFGGFMTKTADRLWG